MVMRVRVFTVAYEHEHNFSIFEIRPEPIEKEFTIKTKRSWRNFCIEFDQKDKWDYLFCVPFTIPLNESRLLSGIL